MSPSPTPHRSPGYSRKRARPDPVRLGEFGQLVRDIVDGKVPPLPEVGNQKSEVGSRTAEVRSQNSDDGSRTAELPLEAPARLPYAD